MSPTAFYGAHLCLLTHNMVPRLEYISRLTAQVHTQSFENIRGAARMSSPDSAIGKVDVIVRPATVSDTPAMGDIAARGFTSNLTNFLYPLRKTYFDDYRTASTMRTRERLYSQRDLSVVAVLGRAGQPETIGRIVGYAQFIREGENASARAFMASRSSLLLRVRGWFYGIYARVWRWMWPDRAASARAFEAFEGTSVVQRMQAWGHDNFKERWHVRSVVVDPDWQRKGIGKQLMNVVLNQARNDGVCVALESSPEGERLYRQVGFGLRQRFNNEFITPEDLRDKHNGGGFMVWAPEGSGLTDGWLGE